MNEEDNSEIKKESDMEGLRISRTTMADQGIRTSRSREMLSEENFLKLLNLESREISLVVDIEGKVKYCNHAIKRLLGYDPGKIIGNNIQSIVPVQQWVGFRAALRASEDAADEPIVIDGRFIDSNDKRHEFSISVRDLSHHPLVEGFVVHAHLIDRLKRQEEKLRLRNIAIETIREAVVIVDPIKKQVVFANNAFFDLSGFTKSEVLGGKLNLFKSPYSEMLFTEPTEPKQIEKFYRATSQKRSFEGRIYSKIKNGSVVYLRMNMTPDLNEKGELNHFVITLKKINSRKKHC